MSNLKPRIFLSYSHKDRDTVRVIKSLLEHREMRVHWDREFRHGTSWSRQMLADLKEADCVVVCWSKQAIKSPIVGNEFFAGYYDEKFVGIALEEDIEYPGLTGEPHHEAYYEWNDENREKRLDHLVKSIRRIAERRNPRVSLKEIGHLVRTVNRRPQAQALTNGLENKLSADCPGLYWLFSANRYERPIEFAKRAGAELLPEQLKQKGIISEDNDESYELELYEIDWPEGYHNVEEAVESMVKALADEVPGDVTNSEDLSSCIQATDSLAPIFYVEMPLRAWRPTDKDVLVEALRRFSAVKFSPAKPKYFLFFVVARFREDSESLVEAESQGFLGRLMRSRVDIDKVLETLVEDDGPYGLLPRLTKIEQHHVDTWLKRTRKRVKIPEEFEEDVVNTVHKPFLEHGSDREHYQVIAPCMRDALKAVFLVEND